MMLLSVCAQCSARACVAAALVVTADVAVAVAVALATNDYRYRELLFTECYAALSLHATYPILHVLCSTTAVCCHAIHCTL
jgi:hypothetical protein